MHGGREDSDSDKGRGRRYVLVENAMFKKAQINTRVPRIGYVRFTILPFWEIKRKIGKKFFELRLCLWLLIPWLRLLWLTAAAAVTAVAVAAEG